MLKLQHPPNNKSSSYYFTLSQKFSSNLPSISSHHHFHSPSQHQHFTFNKDFYPTKQKKNVIPNHSANLSKYRSASLSSQCLVLNPLQNHFSYYDQLKNRSYIVGNKERRMSQLKKDFENLRKNSYDNLYRSNLYPPEQRNHLYPDQSKALRYSTQLNRFSKYDPQNSKKLSKFTLPNKQPLIKTNIKLYNKPDNQNRITQIHSNFEPHQYTSNNGTLIKQQNQQPNGRIGQVPLINCNIEVKSDDEGIYYSTVESQFPGLINGHRLWYDSEENVLTTEAFAVRDFSNPFQNIQFSQHLKGIIFANSLKNQIHAPNVGKGIQTESKKKPQTQIYLQKMQQKSQQNISIEPTLRSPQQIKRKIIIEYQTNSPKKQAKSPKKPSHKKKSTTKTHAQNLGLKYYYSKYYLAEQQNRQRNKSKSSSIRKSEKSEIKQITKRQSSKYNTHHKSSKKLIEAQSPKTKEKVVKPGAANYLSIHLLTAKR